MFNIIIILFIWFIIFFILDDKPINLIIDFIGIIVTTSILLILYFYNNNNDMDIISYMLLIIYASAIAILFGFIIMLYNKGNKEEEMKRINIKYGKDISTMHLNYQSIKDYIIPSNIYFYLIKNKSKYSIELIIFYLLLLFLASHLIMHYISTINWDLFKLFTIPNLFNNIYSILFNSNSYIYVYDLMYDPIFPSVLYILFTYFIHINPFNFLLLILILLLALIAVIFILL